MVLNRLVLASLWLALVIFAFGFAPPSDPKTLALIKALSLGQWQNINPVIIALFNLMGIWPMAYAGMLIGDRQGRKFPAWPFVVGSFFFGAFALLPYLVFWPPTAQTDSPASNSEPSKVNKFWQSPWLGRILFLLAIACVCGAVLLGNWGDYWQQLPTSQFIAVMSSDFLCLTLAFPLLLAQYLHREQGTRSLLIALMAMVPLFGALTYLSIRPNFEVKDQIS
ncbi:hypothetical protein IQE94_04355 [Synechocystis sp. PCC 7339]|uniref:hypothetical protein n=1 Tax=Synechocystis sp. PCC 7339 TaxID=2782213 RepID=UPI001CC1534E|nr:hypothetical protein [Synechocystis sp. PCC 7339]UAJ73544.1 hypothetical protein IQE94_04355 [Synechocystis sp. PCC 7339]